MATSDFLPFAASAGANVLSQAAYAALPAVSTGYGSGIAQSQQVNKTLRQSSIMSAVLGKFIANQSGQNAVDDGTTATLLANLIAAVLATTASQMGNLRDLISYSGNKQLTASDMGKFVYSSVGNATFTLPDATTVPAGSSVYLYSSASAGVLTVTSPNGVFNGPGNNQNSGSLSYSAGVGNQFISSGTSWFVIGAGGIASLSATGYQKLPSGLIEQWGIVTTSASADTTFTFPVAFPNAVVAIVFAAGNSGASIANGYGGTTTSVKVNNWTTAGARASASVTVRAIGY